MQDGLKQREMKLNQDIEDFNKQKVSYDEALDKLNQQEQSLQKQKQLLQEQSNLAKNNVNILQDAKTQIDKFKQLIDNNLYPNDTYSPIGFFDGDLARDVFNMNGNMVSWDYRTYARKFAGLETQGNTSYQNNPPFSTNTNLSPNTPYNQGNKFTNSKDSILSRQKGWAWWVFELSTITLFANIVKWETEDKKLLISIIRAYKIAILSGYAVIEKVNDNYKIYAVSNVERDEFLNPTKATCQIASWFFTDGKYPEKDNDKTIDLTKDNVVLLQWDLDGYNIWFYTVFYTMDYINLIYAFLGRAYFNRAILFQQTGSLVDEVSKKEAQAILNPSNFIIPILTAGIDEDAVNGANSNNLRIGNKYQYIELGNPQATELYSSFPQVWLNIWESVLGANQNSFKSSSARSISDEINPNKQKLNMYQTKYEQTIELFVEDIKTKWNIEVNYTMSYDELEDYSNDPAFKNEGGNESEMKSNNNI